MIGKDRSRTLVIALEVSATIVFLTLLWAAL